MQKTNDHKTVCTISLLNIKINVNLIIKKNY